MFTINWARDVKCARTGGHMCSWNSACLPLCHCTNPGTIHSFIPSENMCWFPTAYAWSHNGEKNGYGLCLLAPPRHENRMRYLVIGDIMRKCRVLRGLQREGPIKMEFHPQQEVVLWAEKPASMGVLSYQEKDSGGQWTGSRGSSVPSSSWACLAIPRES